jgi:hypothetical protein
MSIWHNAEKFTLQCLVAVITPPWIAAVIPSSGKWNMQEDNIPAQCGQIAQLDL